MKTGSSRKRATAAAADGRLLAPGWLHQLGVFGYDQVEDVILAALVTGDPLLLIGKAGTGKTFLLNSLSEALALEHRHYNASLIAFDDLVGFPYPVDGGESIRYIETPATIWQAESVLIDELSRCKPEHQNRLFSLVHERRIQGLDLPRLRYRWAAMNPCGQGDGDEFYEGSSALDQALADRFAFIIKVPDWGELDEPDRRAVADARGVNALSVDEVGLASAVAEGRRRFAGASAALHETAMLYASAVTTQLLKPKIRLSPRRARVLSRNLVALTLVRGGKPDGPTFNLGLRQSLPQPAWGAEVADSVIHAAHKNAWGIAAGGKEGRWLQQVLDEPDVAKRCRLILDAAPSPAMAATAIRQSLLQLEPALAAVFSLALFPAAQRRLGAVGEEGLAALAAHAAKVLEVRGELQWQIPLQGTAAQHPHQELTACAVVLDRLPPKRRERARQLFYHCLVERIALPDPAALERRLDAAIRAVRPFARP